jgi:hypothetical protein
MKKFRKKNKEVPDDFEKDKTDLEAGATNKDGKDDEYQNADEGDQKEKIIWFPKEKKYFWREQALALRKCFKIFAPAHIIFLFFDIYMYNLEIPAIIFDAVMLYANFYNYMVLSKPTIGAEIGLYVLATFVSLTHIKRVLFEAEWWSTTFCFFF